MGLYSPYKFGLKTYQNYDITKLKGYCRFLEVLEDRDYGANGFICALFFDGATSTFKELPLSTDTENLNKVYKIVQQFEAEKINSPFELTNPK